MQSKNIEEIGTIMSEGKKARLKEYQKNCCEDKKCQFSTQQNSFLII